MWNGWPSIGLGGRALRCAGRDLARRIHDGRPGWDWRHDRRSANHRALRMRRFYVRRASRRNGVGRCLAEALMAKARQLERCMVVNAPTAEAARFWEELGFVRDRVTAIRTCLARRWPDCARTLPRLSGSGQWSGGSGQMRVVRQHAHRPASRTVRPDHRPYRLRRVLRQRREARPAGTCGEAGHRRRRRARGGHRRLLRRADVWRAQRHADVQGAEGLSRRRW